MQILNRTALAALAAALVTPLLAAPASAGLTQRPANDRPNTHAHTTAKVLVAYPNDRPRPRNFLYPVRPDHPRAIRRGAPVLLDTSYRPGVGYSLGYVRPTSRIFRYTYNGFGGGGVVADSYLKRKGFETISGSKKTGEGSSRDSAESGSGTTGGTSNAPAMNPEKVGMIIAGGFAPVDTLAADMQNDPMALLAAGRLRDARAAFADAGDTAGEALAATLSGDLETGRDMLAGLADADVSAMSLDDAMTARVTSLRDEMFKDDPAVSGVLTQMLGG